MAACPKCGFILDDFTKQCPRCTRFAAPASAQSSPGRQAPTLQLNGQPVSAPTTRRPPPGAPRMAPGAPRMSPGATRVPPAAPRMAPGAPRPQQPAPTLQLNGQSVAPSPAQRPPSGPSRAALQPAVSDAATKMPIIIGVCLLLVALIVLGDLYLPKYLKQMSGGDVKTSDAAPAPTDTPGGPSPSPQGPGPSPLAPSPTNPSPQPTTPITVPSQGVGGTPPAPGPAPAPVYISPTQVVNPGLSAGTAPITSMTIGGANHVEHIACNDGISYEISLPVAWGASSVQNEVMSVRGFTPKTASFGRYAAIGMFGGGADQPRSPQESTNVFLESLGSSGVNVTRVSEGSMTSSSGTAMHWVVYLTMPQNGESPAKNKAFLISKGTNASKMIFSASPEAFSQYDATFDAIAKSFRYD